MTRILALAGMLLATPALAQTSMLKPGPGRDVVEANCGACHTTDYIRMNAPFLTPAAWKIEVTKMRAVFGSPVNDAVAAEILQYLDANYAATP